MTRDSRSSFDRVGFASHDGELNGFNIDGAAAIYDTSGTHSVTRCSFQGGNDGLETAGITGGGLIVGGRPGMGNTFDLAGTPCSMGDYSDSRSEISHNRMSSLYGESVMVTQGAGATSVDELPPLPAPRYLIHHNRMTAGTIEFDDGGVFGAGGVLLWDDSWQLDEPSRLRAVVAYNRITLDNEGLDGGVNGVGAEGVRVLRNRIRGTGIAGIDAGTPIYEPWGYPVGLDRGWRIVGNDVSGVDPVNSFGGPAAQIWLGASSSDCLVVGGSARTEVLDEGTDNVLIHVTELVTGGAGTVAGRLASVARRQGASAAEEVLTRPGPLAPVCRPGSTECGSSPAGNRPIPTALRLVGHTAGVLRRLPTNPTTLSSAGRASSPAHRSSRRVCAGLACPPASEGICSTWRCPLCSQDAR